MNPYSNFVHTLENSFSQARDFTVPSSETRPKSLGPKVLLFSPHPDDECITGLLPLRLMRELGKQIINVPVTYGSNPERQPERKKELNEACAYLGWGLHQESKDLKALDTSDIVRVLTADQPECIFFPHKKDSNSRHISTHHLLLDALAKMPEDFSCLIVETEYWGAMNKPNLMIEGDTEMVADLVAATSLHRGEVARNPYHLSLPFWMQDNVRRGSELIGGQGTQAPAFTFATLYRISLWQNGKRQPCSLTQKIVPMGSSHLEAVLQSIR